VPPTGIVWEKQTIFDRQATIENSWRGTIDGVQFIVSVGHERERPQRGFVGVHTLSADGRTEEAIGYATPTEGGAVRILASIGSRLTLVAKDGATVVFDVTTRRFVASTEGKAMPISRAPGSLTPTPQRQQP
jgi:hypothetical protein